jgi:hypothetical protein
MCERAKAISGLLLIVAGFPLFYAACRFVEGLGVVALAVAAYLVVGFGVYLSRDWLRISRSKGLLTSTQSGWLETLGSLLVVTSFGAITVYVIFYGARQMMTGTP